MSDVPTTNQGAVTVEKTVMELFNDATSAAETAIETAQPWLKTPVLKQLFEALFSAIVAQISTPLSVSGAYIALDIDKYTALMNAAQAQAALNAAKLTGDPNAIQTASDNVDAAVAPILHYIGDAHQ